MGWNWTVMSESLFGVSALAIPISLKLQITAIDKYPSMAGIKYKHYVVF
jgi:hypothetical protein